jgi:hypothetical protein
MSHLASSRTHEESRSAVCGVCFKKQGLRPITDTQLGQLRNLVDISYCLTNINYQKVLCKTCGLALTAHTAHPEKPGRRLIKPHYKNLRAPPPETRATVSQACPCTVCEIAASSLVPGKFTGPALLGEEYWTLLFPDEPYPAHKKSTSAPSPVESRCALCHSVVGKGRSHKCSKIQMQENLHKLVIQKSMKSKEKIGGKVLKNIFDVKTSDKEGWYCNACHWIQKAPCYPQLEAQQA